jgi:hypothetical protein
MRVEEHTGQLQADYAGELQEQFIRGDVNVLSCSTTFELGVDVGEVQTVLMRNVPPRPSNYVQRAGRAGRRLGAAALVVTYAQRRNHDLHYFERPDDLINGVVSPPIVSIDNVPIVRRHVHAVAFAAYERRCKDMSDVSHPDVHSFFEPKGESPCDDFVEWLATRPSRLSESLQRIVPPAVAAEVGTDDWSWVDRLVEGDEEGFGWLARARDEVRGDLAEVRAEVERAVEEEQYSYAGALKAMSKTLASRQLIGYLAQRVVLPKYGFPVDVVDLDVARPGDFDAAKLELQRDLSTAISEYAPGSQLVAKGSLWEPTGLRKPPGKALIKRRWATCPTCGAFSTWLSQRDLGCPKCGDASPMMVKGRSFIQPIFGFLGQRSKDKPGETRPMKGGFARSYFDDYAGSQPDWESLALGGSSALEHRSSRQGRITVINQGRGSRGFQICRSCGAAQESIVSKAKPKPHSKPFNPKLQCDGILEFTDLGHQYLTDVLEIGLTPGPLSDWSTAHSVLYALLHGARDVGVAPSDIDGTVKRSGGLGELSLVLFDSVPGGAGHSLHIAQNLREVIEGGLSIVESCECGPETSCYACLRSYTNQLHHDDLKRGLAAGVLRSLLT